LIYKHNNPLHLVRKQYSLYQAYYSLSDPMRYPYQIN
jgi:hypothetical protein